MLIGVGRAVADGIDCSYICDVAVHPDFQGKGIGTISSSCSGTCPPVTRRSSSTPIPARRGFYRKLRLPAHAHRDGDLQG
jgi:GNAT superfamily N-acetyltransferase